MKFKIENVSFHVGLRMFLIWEMITFILSPASAPVQKFKFYVSFQNQKSTCINFQISPVDENKILYFFSKLKFILPSQP